MRKAFTLLELMIVIIIVAILAVVAIIQYNLAIERARSAEAREVLGNLRDSCAVIYARDHSVINCTPHNLGIGTEPGTIPLECCRSHYFSYSAEESPSFENVMVFTANRCMKYGRAPDSKEPGAIAMTFDYVNGTHSISARGAY
ncbi:MAG: prepilin-type N-terminal cleavage/methylation domain-containing protein [Candidatus Omnitrophica bacterium]|nr:prepilin-type N-terminal cleavage/methylation domain-containing protein [Candidatus Omnitrophota bacterium]MDD4941636.1 prepilin-type N-terminal cleavage/methylation domain-containing protein [Candidatus Omnitrophota bacterium]MDD5774783.1 prepilin-type N-terminal cleavage/methylation domain-containing protein [Candidatus Omnitrophota bacterium]HNQ50636.1 prepilin-type N-terminal cleavage/methylation domain-containing protein [Candidatus Omnitrophota bacterium]HQO37658.1 prepilin-type N-term